MQTRTDFSEYSPHPISLLSSQQVPLNYNLMETIENRKKLNQLILIRSSREIPNKQTNQPKLQPAFLGDVLSILKRSLQTDSFTHRF